MNALYGVSTINHSSFFFSLLAVGVIRIYSRSTTIQSDALKNALSFHDARKLKTILLVGYLVYILSLYINLSWQK